MARIVTELFIPLILSNIIHMIVVKKDLYLELKKPINKNFFGENKTVRGFIIVPLMTGVFQIIISSLIFNESFLYSFSMGVILGFTYVLFELPNSYYKRSIGIKAGQAPRTLKFLLIDKMDSALGISLVYTFINDLIWFYFITLFFMAFTVHLTFSFGLHKLKLKESV